MKGNIYFLSVIILIMFSSCNKERLFIYSKDKKQCITVITYRDSGIRYVINGKHFKIPDTNYIKLDVSHIGSLADGILGCWQKNSNVWQITIDGAIVLENRLDTARFKFSNELPVDSRGIPTQIKFTKDNCFVYDFDLNRIIPEDGDAIIE